MPAEVHDPASDGLASRVKARFSHESPNHEGVVSMRPPRTCYSKSTSLPQNEKPTRRKVLGGVQIRVDYARRGAACCARMNMTCLTIGR